MSRTAVQNEEDDESTVYVMNYGAIKKLILDATAAGKKYAHTGKRVERETGFVPLATMSPEEWKHLAEVLVKEKLGELRGGF